MTKLRELDIQDKEGNIVISPDLKVRHRDSQYEYTVDSVTKDEQGQNVVLLRMPEEPRIDPSDSPEEPELMRSLSGGDVLYEVDPSVVVYEPDKTLDDDTEVDPDTSEDLLAVPSAEFEKEYEVK